MAEILGDRRAQFVAIEKNDRAAGFAKPARKSLANRRLAGAGKAGNPKYPARQIARRHHFITWQSKHGARLQPNIVAFTCIIEVQ
ncbi:MAG TPA: hypothetical protein VMU87_05675 [Stellaceae bacterium]|nr:hypothetical protein [Stellaceae bacterium]